jgi:hypothetical protein
MTTLAMGSTVAEQPQSSAPVPAPEPLTSGNTHIYQQFTFNEGAANHVAEPLLSRPRLPFFERS